ncbi:MAG: hypothetical protein R2942_19315 [Ignavibacteria bacterium]
MRTISYMKRRITEAEKLGFRKIIIPKGNLKNLNLKKFKIKVEGVGKIKEASELII